MGILIFAVLGILMAMPISAMDFSAPEAPATAKEFLPEKADSFAEGLWNVLRQSAQVLMPSISEAARVCLRTFGAVLLVALVGQAVPGISARALGLAGVAAVSALLLEPSVSLMELGLETTGELRDYGKLLLPVLAAGLAAQGGVTAGSALYAGTAVFDGILSSMMTAILIPVIWAFLALSIGYAALGESMLGKIRTLVGKAMECTLKGGLTVFTTYMTITGVVSGTADATAAKAARAAISAGIPVVGGILSDAADAVLVSAGTLAGGAGVWGVMTVLAVACAPVLKLGCQYLLLKMTAALCAGVAEAAWTGLVGDFATALGMLLALVGTQTVLLLISAICFLRGVGG